MTPLEQKNDFDLHITRKEAEALALPLIDMLREFVQYGLCRAGNTWERKGLVEKFHSLAKEAQGKFPNMKLHHCGAKTIIEETQP